MMLECSEIAVIIKKLKMAISFQLDQCTKSEPKRYNLVGDSAYPLSPWLQKPYPEGTGDPAEIRFNKKLSFARVVVE